MLSKLLILACSVASALAADGVFHPPQAKSFISIDYQVGFPINTTTPNGIVVTVPVWGGEITGIFNGHIVPNITSSVESYLQNAGGVYTSFDARYLFENDAGEHLVATVVGTTSYSNVDLHGFGYATLTTDIENLKWVNTGMFVAEWQATLETGKAEIQIFELSSGGRVDCSPIHAITPR
ncbi:hypothetical protein AJ78_01361 [Emergomyces pasteurianus Ep9510]|uniref:Uncharacterized protein n=1 Tax=Emergomyces pasteurianus Ep9510 TaxID=1447872 RepID=A0A1J9PQF1_9EURO|nr:hypothetical protein AJ78_01361 [Emergomyces pasteurianus Ep9510]